MEDSASRHIQKDTSKKHIPDKKSKKSSRDPLHDRATSSAQKLLDLLPSNKEADHCYDKLPKGAFNYLIDLVLSSDDLYAEDCVIDTLGSVLTSIELPWAKMALEKFFFMIQDERLTQDFRSKIVDLLTGNLLSEEDPNLRKELASYLGPILFSKYVDQKTKKSIIDSYVQNLSSAHASDTEDIIISFLCSLVRNEHCTHELRQHAVKAITVTGLGSKLNQNSMEKVDLLADDIEGRRLR